MKFMNVFTLCALGGALYKGGHSVRDYLKDRGYVRTRVSPPNCKDLLWAAIPSGIGGGVAGAALSKMGSYFLVDPLRTAYRCFTPLTENDVDCSGLDYLQISRLTFPLIIGLAVHVIRVHAQDQSGQRSNLSRYSSISILTSQAERQSLLESNELVR